MMISSNSTTVYGNSKLINSVENGLPPNEDEIVDEVEQTETVRDVAARVVDVVVRMASEAAQNAQKQEKSTPPKFKGCNLQRLPTIQIDTVQSPPPSPDESSPLQEISEGNELLDENEIQLDVGFEEQPDVISEDLRESLKSYVENILSEAMVVAEKKLQFAGLPEEDEEESEEEQVVAHLEEEESEKPEEEEEEAVDESEIRAAAEKVVEEIIAKASETIAERREKEIAALTFPITFDEAPEDVKELATSMVKEIVGKAIAMAEEKAVPTVPFNFEDVDLMKTSGPWYIRAREALVRVLRTACFCTPRRNDS